jgi:hypothetical protein
MIYETPFRLGTGVEPCPGGLRQTMLLVWPQSYPFSGYNVLVYICYEVMVIMFYSLVIKFHRDTRDEIPHRDQGRNNYHIILDVIPIAIDVDL